MKIVQVSAEFAPIAKAGGMGEVLLGLSRELTEMGHEVDVIIPKYDFLDLKKMQHVSMEIPDFKCMESGSLHANAVWAAKSEGCRLHLVEARHPAGYFHRGKIYGCEDDAKRFLYFCKAVMEYLKLRGKEIDVLHLHDWHTAACAVLAKDLFQLPIKSTLLTLHNIEYQGRCATWDLDAIGLQGVHYLTADRMQDNDPAYSKAINLLKGGIVYADALNAVSPSYAKEILTSEAGFYLDRTLRKLKEKLSGILNGIDQVLWNPSNDPNLPAHFSQKSSTSSIVASKQKMRWQLSQHFKIEENRRPWIGAVTRLVSQKSPELLEAAVHKTADMGGTFLLLGTAPQPQVQHHFEELKKKYKNNPSAFLHFEYDEALAHQIYAALDYLLIPSRFEPCGLTQLIAMRYGTVPIARATGGLKDTIFDYERSSLPMHQRNGLLFPEATEPSMNEALERAFSLFHQNPAEFQNLILRDLSWDSSWKRPALEYVRLYNNLIQALKASLM